MKHRKIRMALYIIIGIVAVIAVGTIVFVNQPQFGRKPRASEQEAAKKSGIPVIVAKIGEVILLPAHDRL